MEPKIYLIKSSDVPPSLIKELEGKNYDIVITHQDDLSQENIKEIVAQAKFKFIELTERLKVKSTGIHSIPQNIQRSKRKRIVR